MDGVKRDERNLAFESVEKMAKKLTVEMMES